jgi:hypothetical protein
MNRTSSGMPPKPPTSPSAQHPRVCDELDLGDPVAAKDDDPRHPSSPEMASIPDHTRGPSERQRSTQREPVDLSEGCLVGGAAAIGVAPRSG